MFCLQLLHWRITISTFRRETETVLLFHDIDTCVVVLVCGHDLQQLCSFPAKKSELNNFPIASFTTLCISLEGKWRCTTRSLLEPKTTSSKVPRWKPESHKPTKTNTPSLLVYRRPRGTASGGRCVRRWTFSCARSTLCNGSCGRLRGPGWTLGVLGMLPTVTNRLEGSGGADVNYLDETVSVSERTRQVRPVHENPPSENHA